MVQVVVGVTTDRVMPPRPLAPLTRVWLFGLGCCFLDTGGGGEDMLVLG